MLPSLLSVIIPACNEAENLPKLLQDLAAQERIDLEIIVVDGGSRDATCALAAAFSVRVIHSVRGRGAQMNRGAAVATGDLFLFLHADSRMADQGLLCQAVDALKRAGAGDQRIAGHFPLHFLRSSNRNALAYRYAEEKSALNRVNTTNGDQGLLLPREFFRELGGFAESLPFLEDQRLAEKIRREGRWITLPGKIGTSARRFEREGFHRRYILMSMMMGFHSIGEKEFFARAPGLYQVQEETGKLLLTPFFALIRKMIFAWGGGRSLRIFYRLGRYIRQNSWQIFFFVDVCLRPHLGAGRYPFLCFHDRFFTPLISNRVSDALTGVLAFVWFLGILTPFFWMAESFPWQQKARGKAGTSP